MMLNKNDQDRVTQLLTDAITVLCKNGLNYASHFSIEGLLGITLDEQEVFLVKIDETVRGESIAGTYKAPAPHSEPTQRTSTTSPRFRGRARGRTLVNSRGRFSFSNRKRSLFGGVVKPSTTNPLHAKSVNDGGGGEPPSKVRLQGNVTPRTTPAQRNDIIEIADEENGSSNGSQVPSDIKSEPPDFTHSMPADSTQEPDPKYALDSETSRNLTNYLDTLMTSHSAGRGGNAASSQAVGAPSSPAAAAGSSALSHIAHHTPPKSEPQPWDQQQFTSGSPPAHPQQKESPAGRQFVWTPLQIPKVNFKTEPGTSPIKFATPSRSESNGRRKPANPRKAVKNPTAVKVNGNSPKGGKGDKKDAVTLFQCKYCENTFTSKTGLQNHIYSQHKDHTQKQFACDKCPKRFMTYGSLHRHKNAHKGIYAHMCPFCDKGYANGKDLEGHMYKHTGVKPFQCSGCDMTFAYKCNLMSHIKTMHKDNPNAEMKV